MNFNKSLLRIANRKHLSHISYNSRGSKTLATSKCYNIFIRKPSKETCLESCRVLSQSTLFNFSSSAANEEQIKSKNLCPIINVPHLQFEDLTFGQPVTHSELCNAVQICDSVEEQMLALTSALALSPDDVENRIYFCKVIESLLKPFFGDIRIQMFGSTVNGFGFKGCDIDMSFETFAEQKEEISYLEVPDVPLVCEVMSGKVSPLEISLLPPKEQLLFIHSVFLEFYKESEDPTIFINAHVPLVRFYHDKYGLKCDLTCRNKVAFSNTKLLYLFGKLDERTIPLMMTIRYWAKHVELIGKGLLFNTYTISLMVIHFLQATNPPVLPSAEHILSISDSLKIEDMSDNSFLQIKRYIPPSENNQTLSELLRDFFFFYLYFDFTRVISPLIGGSVSREQFFSTASKKFRMNSICVQDPMSVNHNVAELVDYKHCKMFFTEVVAACRLFQSGCNLSPSPSKWGISYLLDEIDDLKNTTWQKRLSFTVPHTTKQIVQSTVTEDKNLITAETLLYILRHVLLMECKPLNTHEVIQMLKQHDEAIERQKKFCESKIQLSNEVYEPLRKYRKRTNNSQLELQQFPDALMLEEFQKFSSENKLIFSFECKADKNSWLGRDHISLDSLPVDFYNDLVKKEQYISIHASKQNELVAKNSKKKIEPFVFTCECYASHVSPESLLLNFRPYQKTSFNPVLAIFLKQYLPKIMKSLNEAC